MLSKAQTDAHQYGQPEKVPELRRRWPKEREAAMLYKELALKYVAEKEPKGFILHEYEDHPDYYVFGYQHYERIYIGQGPIIINKQDLRFFIYGSAYGLDGAVQDYTEKMRLEQIARKYFPEIDIQKTYNISIANLKRPERLIHKMVELRFSYVIPEIVADVIFRVPERYNVKLLQKRLAKLPCTFHGIPGQSVCEIIALNEEYSTVALQLSEWIYIEREKRAEHATPEDLETIW